jgi:hypothetical protein
MALGQAFLRVLRFCPVSIISPLLHVYSYISWRMDEKPIRDPVSQTQSHSPHPDSSNHLQELHAVATQMTCNVRGDTIFVCPVCLKQGEKCLWSGQSCQLAVSCLVERRPSPRSSARAVSPEHRPRCGVHPLRVSTVPSVSCVLLRNLTLSLSVELRLTLACSIRINLDFCKVGNCQRTDSAFILHQVDLVVFIFCRPKFSDTVYFCCIDWAV